MQYRQDPYVSRGDLEDDPIVADAQLPIAAERATERHPEALRVCSEPRLDQSADTPTGLGRNLREVVCAYRRVVAKDVRHSALLCAMPPPYLVVRER